MTPESAFNNEIKSLLKTENSNCSELINTLLNGKRIQSYYVFFDSLCFKLGISFHGKMCINDKDRVVGYFPIIDYKPNNLLNVEPKEDMLTANYLSESQCYKYIAKSIVYKLIQVPNINAIIKSI